MVGDGQRDSPIPLFLEPEERDRERPIRRSTEDLLKLAGVEAESGHTHHQHIRFTLIVEIAQLVADHRRVEGFPAEAPADIGGQGPGFLGPALSLDLNPAKGSPAPGKGCLLERLFEFDPGIADVPEPSCWIATQTTPQKPTLARGQIAGQVVPIGSVSKDCGKRFACRIPSEKASPHEHLPQHDPERLEYRRAYPPPGPAPARDSCMPRCRAVCPRRSSGRSTSANLQAIDLLPPAEWPLPARSRGF